MSKFLVLNFRDAKLFSKNIRSKDKVYDMINGKGDRKNQECFIEPITVHQVSNMLHVLFNERPVPSFRYVPYSRVEPIFNMALNSYIKIDTHQRYNENKKVNEYTKETIQIKKSGWNSWNPVTKINWYKIKRLLGDTLYLDFITITSDILGYNVETKTFNDIRPILLEINDTRFDTLLDTLKGSGKAPLVNYVRNTSDTGGDFNKKVNYGIAETVLRGIDKVSALSGTIYVPVDDGDIEKLRQSKGCATILDGGLVFIKGIEDGDELDVDGFKIMSEISTEKH